MKDMDLFGNSFGNNFKMGREKIYNSLVYLNDKLKAKGLKGEVNLVGGAVLCLVYNARPSTHDIDGVFVPKSEIYNCIKEVALERDMPEDWFNDAVKGFLSPLAEFILYKDFSNLRVMVASAEYLLAMKLLASRVDNQNEINDIRFLIKELNIKKASECEVIITKYYNPKLILPKTMFLLEELLGGEDLC